MTEVTNKFESRAIETITKVVAFIASTQENIRKNLDTTAQFKDEDESLTRLSENQEDIVLDAIKTKQNGIKQRLDGLDSEKTRLENALTDYKSKLSILQEVCPHINSVHDHEDYHNNTSWDKCTLCNKVF